MRRTIRKDSMTEEEGWSPNRIAVPGPLHSLDSNERASGNRRTVRLPGRGIGISAKLVRQDVAGGPGIKRYWST